MSKFSVSHKELCEELINCGKNVNALTEFIKAKNNDLTEEQINFVKRDISQRFLSSFNKRWTDSYRRINYFFEKNENWLKSKYILIIQKKS